MDLGLKDRVALVCAASKGLGRAVAQALAAEGARVAICGRSAVTLGDAENAIRSATGGSLLALAADVTRPEDVGNLVDSILRKWGTIHILVNNAGGPPAGPFESHSLEDWQRAVELNLMSAVRLCSLVVPHMKRQKWGRIINITSITVKQPVGGLILSNSVRAAVAGLSKSLADELAPYNILVNTVCPGYTRTDRVVQLAKKLATEGKSEKDVFEEWGKSIPLGRLAEPEEFASAVAFLASERASYITGTTLAVDGGFVRGLL